MSMYSIYTVRNVNDRTQGCEQINANRSQNVRKLRTSSYPSLDMVWEIEFVSRTNVQFAY